MDYYTEIKNELIDNEITKKAKDYSKNKSDLMHYYNVGKLLIEAQGGETRAKYGDGLIREYSRRLASELNKKYSYRNLMSMRKFYLLLKNEKVNALRTQLSWTHYRELLVLSDFDEIKYYIDISIDSNLSYRELHNEIKNELVENEITKRAKDYSKNKSDLMHYYNVGKLLIDAGKHYGEGIIKKYSRQLTIYLGKGYTETNLKYYRQFYLFSKSHTMCDELTWSHYRVLLSISDKSKVDYYIYVTRLRRLTVRQLQTVIKLNEYERLDDKSKNNKLIMEYCSDSRIISREYVLL